MRRVPKPQYASGEVYRLCTSVVRDAELKARLDEIDQWIDDAAGEYDAAGISHRFHEISAHDSVGRVTSAELKSIYSGRMVGQLSPGRKIYDALRSAAPAGICPLCNIRDVATLDHYLPQSRYPGFAVMPLNLIPTCFPCNDRKGVLWPSTSEQQMLHPYYDDAETTQWLAARVLETAPAAIIFFVKTLDGWDDVMVARVNRHFHQLQLNMLYGSQAAVEISLIRGRLRNLYSAGGSAAVHEHLAGMAASCAESRQQTWHAAAYRALAESIWYCERGFDGT